MVSNFSLKVGQMLKHILHSVVLSSHSKFYISGYRSYMYMWFEYDFSYASKNYLLIYYFLNIKKIANTSKISTINIITVLKSLTHNSYSGFISSQTIQLPVPFLWYHLLDSAWCSSLSPMGSTTSFSIFWRIINQSFFW